MLQKWRKRTSHGRLAVLTLWTLAVFCGREIGAAANHGGEAKEGVWKQRPLGAASWKGHTLTVTEGDLVVFLHGHHVTVYDSEGGAEHLRSVLPVEVTPGAAVAAGPDRSLFLAGAGGDVYLISTADWRAVRLPSLVPAPKTGLRLSIGPEGMLYAASGLDGDNFRSDNFKRLHAGRWSSLASVSLVNRLGTFSAGLHSAPGGFVAFGDHHVGYYHLAADRWVKVVGVLGIRPALGRGGMSARDPESGELYFTLGKGSTALGCTVGLRDRPADDNRLGFRYLRPRLPVGIDDSGETLFITHRDAVDLLNVVSPKQDLWLSIPMAELTRAWGWTGETGAWQGRGGGELVREKDSITNMVHIPPYVYTQRKNVVRRFHSGIKYRLRGRTIERIPYSKNMAGYHYGRRFIAAGSAAVTDGSRQIFLCTGHDRIFYSLHLRQRADGRANDGDALLEIEDMLVTELAPLPEALSGNTALVWSRGKVFALLNTDSRKIHEYDHEINRWRDVASLPAEFPYSAGLGADLVAFGRRLLVLSGDRGAWLDPRTWSWEKLPPLAFTYSSDGGMAVTDEVERKVYVVVGGSSRDLGIISLEDGSSRLWKDALPDLVSVHGRRAWIADVEGLRYLYVYRGHDSNEMWRHRLPLEEELTDQVQSIYPRARSSSASSSPASRLRVPSVTGSASCSK